MTNRTKIDEIIIGLLNSESMIPGLKTLDSVMVDEASLNLGEFLFGIKQTPYEDEVCYEMHLLPSKEYQLLQKIHGLRSLDQPTIGEFLKYFKDSGKADTLCYQELENINENSPEGYVDLVVGLVKSNLSDVFSVDHNQLPEELRRLVAIYHTHYGEDFCPPSKLDKVSSYDLPAYVGAYSRRKNVTRLYSILNGDENVVEEISHQTDMKEKLKDLSTRPKISRIIKKGRYILKIEDVSGIKGYYEIRFKDSKCHKQSYSSPPGSVVNTHEVPGDSVLGERVIYVVINNLNRASAIEIEKGSSRLLSGNN